MIVLDTFFGCYKLRTGCLFIGYSGAICGILIFIASGVGIFISNGHIASSTEGSYGYYFILALCSYLFIVSAAAVALNILLLVGIYKERTKLLNFFLFSMIPYLFVIFVGAIFASSINSCGLLFEGYFGFQLYYLLVIRSHRKELDYAKDQLLKCEEKNV